MRISYSSVKEFSKCPYSFYRTRVVRDVEPQESYAMRFGDIVHRYIERVLLGKRSRVPLFKGIQDANPIVDLFRPSEEWDTFPEMGFALKYDWTTELSTRGDVLDEEVWMLGFCDVVQISKCGTKARVVDWKTGNSRYPDPDQIELMALLVMLHYPKVEEVQGALIFLKDYKSTRTTYFRSNMALVQHKWAVQVVTIDKAVAESNLPKTPSVLCAWCPVLDCNYREEAILLRDLKAQARLTKSKKEVKNGKKGQRREENEGGKEMEQETPRGTEGDEGEDAQEG